MQQHGSRKTVRKQGLLTFSALLFIMLAPSQAFAAAAPIVGAVEWVLDLLTNQIARTVAIIAIVILGYMAWAGKLTWERAISLVVGIVLIFGAAAIVDAIIGATGGGA